MVEINFKPPFFHLRKAVEADHANIYGKEAQKGKRVTSVGLYDERLAHPDNMDKYDKWANDPEANIAFDVLTDIIAGVGYHTEMPEDINPDHKHKGIIDEYGETVNLDEKLQEITMTMLQKGFCPVERIEEYDLKIYRPETFYIYKDKKANLIKYTQEHSYGDVVTTWKTKEELESIILFFHRKTTSWPYGKSLVEPIGPLLDEREQMNKDMPKAVHRWAYPIPVVSTSRSKDAVQTAFTDRDVDEAVFIGNVQKEEFKMDTLAIDPQARFIPYIELLYYQICEGLHAPLLLYLKNATEASATVMMESVDRLVNGIQSHIKRRVERYLFEPQVGKPVPRLVWGQPKTGLEEVTLADVAAIIPHLAPNQQLDLLKQFGIELPEPEYIQPKLPIIPPEKPVQTPTIPMEQMLDKLNDMNTALNIIMENRKAGKINLIKAMELGGKTIEVYLARAYGKNSATYIDKRDVEFEKWSRRLIGAKNGKTYTVKVDD